MKPPRAANAIVRGDQPPGSAERDSRALAERGYHLAMLYFKARGRFLVKGSPAAEWGRFVSYIEAADDQEASRQVNVFQNGNVMRYDRSHSRDEFGRLVGLKFSRQPKWRRFFPGAEILTPSEFEAVWREALQRAEIL